MYLLSIPKVLPNICVVQLGGADPGAGACFRVSLPCPVLVSPASTPGEGPVSGTPLRQPSRALKVLVAEDHPTNRAVVSLILEPLGVQLTMVEDGRQAVARHLDAVLALGVPAPVVLAATHERTLEIVPLELQRRVVNDLVKHRDYQFIIGYQVSRLVNTVPLTPVYRADYAHPLTTARPVTRRSAILRRRVHVNQARLAQ